MTTQPSSSESLDLTAAIAAEAAAAPTNRAARRAAKRGKDGEFHVSDQARYQPPAHARPQQGRRINPVRRTGS
ncbi:hypothetical protein ACQEVB_20865 [Pseudonocardia sp. CA-107938]|uniref:hypothetical protein n=1 Tax=Pseudonocardia sp. CA-107938 TaxID=3240021 RepID=UPI003D8D22C4